MATTAAPKPKRRYADSVFVRYVRSLPQEFYLLREASFQLGCAPSLLGYLATHYPELGPTHQASYGAVELRLYTPQRIEEIRRHLESKNGRRGAKRIFTPAEQIERRRRAQEIRNWTVQADVLAARGRNAQADEARAKAVALRAEFNATRQARCEELGIPDAYKRRTGQRNPKATMD